MNKVKYIVLFFLIFLISGCAEIQLPPEGTKCSWYINDTYEADNNSNNLYLSMQNLFEKNADPTLNFYFNGIDDYGFSFSGLKGDVEVEYRDRMKDGVYEIDLYGDQSIRLSFEFNDQNIKQSDSDAICPYPTLYYKLGDGAITTFDFSTEYQDEGTSFITIFNEKNKDNNDKYDCGCDELEDGSLAQFKCLENCTPQNKENWCSTFYSIRDSMNVNNAYFMIYYWKKDDGNIYYAINKQDEEINSDNLASYSVFKENYNWTNVEDEFKFSETIGSTVFTLVDFKNMSSGVFANDEGKLVCPSGQTVDSTAAGGASTGEYDAEDIVKLDGTKFRLLVRSLEPYFHRLATYKGVNINGKLSIEINGTETPFSWFNYYGDLSNIKDDEIEYLTEQKIKDVVEYCNSFYATAASNREKDGFDKRMYECISFGDMLTEAATIGLTGDLKGNCNILSSDFVDILKQILDIIKIAGPLLALGLGTLDFIKSIVSGDADKGSKEAFKKFSTRLIAAVLLFIIPFVLAFLMDIFLGNQDGYNSENPFCGIVEWDDYKK